MAMPAPIELNTWMLGSTFVGVSVLYRTFTISVNILSRGNTVGLKFNAFGKTVHMIRRLSYLKIKKHIVCKIPIYP